MSNNQDNIVRYPLFIPMLAAIAGIATTPNLFNDSSLAFLFALATALSSVTAIAIRRHATAWLMILLSVFLLFGGRSAAFLEEYTHSQIGSLLNQHDGRTPTLRLHGTVVSGIAPGEDQVSCYLLVEKLETAEKTIFPREKVYLTVQLSDRWKLEDLHFTYGDRIVFPGVISRPRSFENPGSIDSRQWFKEKGLQGSVFLKSPILISRTPGYFKPLQVFFKYRSMVIEKIYHHFASKGELDDAAGMFMALSTGLREFISKEHKLLLRNSGIMHVIAISGFHVAIVAAAMLFFLRLLRVPPPWIELLLIPLLLIYWLITGMSIATTRATFLAVGWLISRLVNRDGSSINMICLVALVLLLTDPRQLFSPGFQLSFAAAFGLITFPSTLASAFPIFDRLPRVLVATLSAQLWTFPLVMHHFNQVIGQALINNFILLPVISIVVVLGAAYLLLFHWIPLLGPAVLWLAGEIMALVNGILLYLQQWLPWNFRSASPGPGLISSALILLFITYLLNRYIDRMLITRLMLITPFLLLLLLQPQRSAPEKASVDILDIGMGDANVLKTSSGSVVVIDAGGSPIDDFDYGEHVLSRFLWHESIMQIDVLILTHMDADHAEGAVALLKNFSVTELWLPRWHSQNELSREILRLAEKQKVKLRYLTRGDSLMVDEVGFYILNPPETEKIEQEAANNNAMVIQMILERWQLIFTADAEIPALQQTIKALRATGLPTVLKVAHHGSRDAHLPAFIEKMDVRQAVVSASQFNVYGFPHAETVDYFSRRDIPLLQTGLSGMVHLQEEQASLRIRTGRTKTYRSQTINLAKGEYAQIF